MRENFKPGTDERPLMIVFGIVVLYFLVVLFFVYLYLLHRISLSVCFGVVAVFSLIYLPRFIIIKKIIKKDDIKILDNSILINGAQIGFQQIKDYRVEGKKPVVVFVISNNLIVFNEAKFHLLLDNKQVSFSAIGAEKIKLLKEFLNEIIS